MAELTPEQIKTGFLGVQQTITDFLERITGQVFLEENWEYTKGKGGGRTRVMEAEPSVNPKAVLERGGVNFSFIEGVGMPQSAATALNIPPNKPYIATGVSLVLHPVNPWVPTVHLNIRYFQCEDLWWFGGGIDVTPYYTNEADVIEIHTLLKGICEKHGENYQTYKEECDRYFTIKHRNMMRGIGGLFADHLRTDKVKNFEFVKDIALSLLPIYDKLVNSYKDKEYSDEQRLFQLYRRGHYAEFNLVYDRGTQFGLSSNGRTESILMSLPLNCKWIYGWKPVAGSPEEKLFNYFLQPQDWVNKSASDEEEWKALNQRTKEQIAAKHAQDRASCAKHCITTSLALVTAGLAVGLTIGGLVSFPKKK